MIYRQVYEKIQAIIVGGLLFALTGLGVAHFDIVFSDPGHPHGMKELLYFIMPMLLSPVGALLGLIFSLKLNNNELINIVRYVAVSSLIVFFMDIVLHLANIDGLFTAFVLTVGYIFSW